MINWIDGVARDVTAGSFSIPAIYDPTAGTPGWAGFLKDSSCGRYDVTHHDWS